MKKYGIRFLAIATCLLTTLTACEIETHDNGKLDGFWHLEQIDTIATGGVSDVGQQRLFWSVQSKLVELSDHSVLPNPKYIFSFRHSDGALSLFDARISDRREGDVPLTDINIVRPFGVNMLEENFEVEALDGGKMILKSQTLRLRLKKF